MDIKQFVKILACVSFFIFWLLWICTSPKVSEQKITHLDNIKNTTAKPDIIKPELEVLKPEIAYLHIKEKQEEVRKEKEDGKREKKETVSSSNQTTIPQTVEMKEEKVKQNLQKEESKTIENETVTTELREKTLVDKNKKFSFLAHYKEKINQESLDMLFQESWLPMYIQNKDKFLEKPKEATTNLDESVNNILLVGLLNDPNGSKVAVIRDTQNKNLNFIAPGDSYKGLKLLNINQDSIILWNETLDRKYVKRLNTN